MKEVLANPTGYAIRGWDNWGSGAYGASRGTGRVHNGVDFVCVPGQSIIAPIDGMIAREAKPYAGLKFSGLLIKGPTMTLKMFYFEPDMSLIGDYVVQGTPIGIAQDIGEKYNNITPHIHLGITSIDPAIVVGLFISENSRITIKNT